MKNKIENKIQNTEERFTAGKSPLIPLLQRGRLLFYSPLWQRGGRGDSLNGYKATALFIFLLFISACGGEGGGGGSSPTGPSTTVAFSGSSSPASNTVYMAKNSSLSSGSTLAIDVKVNNVSSIYGAAFDVVFNSSGMTYASYVKGDFLGTVEPSVMLQSGSSNKLVVGVSKQGTATGVTGSGTLVTLKFDLTSGGNLTFSNNDLRDSSNQQIANVTWSGGTATVQ